MTPRIIGLGGALRSGKDAIADRLVERHGFTKFGMSDALLEHALINDPYIPLESIPTGLGTEQGTFVRFSHLVNTIGYVEAKKNPEVRRYLQADGTEGGRRFFYEDVWVDKIAERIAGVERAVITGVRFPNELAMVERLGGTTVWVERPGLDSATPAAAHASENSVTSAEFRITLHNDGTLEDLHAAVDDFMKGLS